MNIATKYVNNNNNNSNKENALNMSEKLQIRKTLLYAMTKELLNKQQIDMITYHKMCEKIKALKS